jgi:hypothetical protein
LGERRIGESWATMLKKVAVLVTGVAVIIALACQRSRPVYDGFETGRLSEQWETTKFLPGAVCIQQARVRTGTGAAEITLRPGDQIPSESGSELERAEIAESRRLWSWEDSFHEYAFSVLLPKEFPVVSTRLVIAQWKQRCPTDQCTPDNPILAVRYQGGELVIAKQVGAEKEVLYRTRDDIRDRWLDFRFQVGFSRGQSGRIKVWLGDKLLIDHKGATAYPESAGYARPGRFYFKIGLYRDRMSEPMTIYVDEYRKKVLPGGPT